MNIFGLNSPEIFLISIIILSILGTKRIEKGWILFQQLLKYLLNNEINLADSKTNTKLDEDSEKKDSEEKESKGSIKKEEVKEEVKEEKDSEDSKVK